jgi:hypothetical protein
MGKSLREYPRARFLTLDAAMTAVPRPCHAGQVVDELHRDSTMDGSGVLGHVETGTVRACDIYGASSAESSRHQ